MITLEKIQEGGVHFTGKVNKVTIDLKEMKTADKEKADKAQKEASVRKALPD